MPRLGIFSLLAVVIVAPLVAYSTYGFAYLWYSAPDAGALPFSSGFESGDLAEWQARGARQLCCEDSLEIVGAPVRSGRYAAKFTVRLDDPLVKGNKRAELRLKAATFGREYRYAFSLFVPEDWPASENVTNLAQWHGVRDLLLGETGRSAPLTLDIVGERFAITVNWDSARITKSWFYSSGSDGSAGLWSGPLERGRWIDWVFTLRWSDGEEGFIAVDKDGQRILERRGANSYNDWLAPYFKFGVYPWGWAVAEQTPPVERRVLYFDAIEVR